MVHVHPFSISMLHDRRIYRETREKVILQLLRYLVDFYLSISLSLHLFWGSYAIRGTSWCIVHVNMYYSHFYLIYLDPQPARKCGYITPTC